MNTLFLTVLLVAEPSAEKYRFTSDIQPNFFMVSLQDVPVRSASGDQLDLALFLGGGKASSGSMTLRLAKCEMAIASKSKLDGRRLALRVGERRFVLARPKTVRVPLINLSLTRIDCPSEVATADFRGASIAIAVDGQWYASERAATRHLHRLDRGLRRGWKVLGGPPTKTPKGATSGRTRFSVPVRKAAPPYATGTVVFDLPPHVSRGDVELRVVDLPSGKRRRVPYPADHHLVLPASRYRLIVRHEDSNTVWRHTVELQPSALSLVSPSFRH